MAENGAVQDELVTAANEAGERIRQDEGNLPPLSKQFRPLS